MASSLSPFIIRENLAFSRKEKNDRGEEIRYSGATRGVPVRGWGSVGLQDMRPSQDEEDLHAEAVVNYLKCGSRFFDGLPGCAPAVCSAGTVHAHERRGGDRRGWQYGAVRPL